MGINDGKFYDARQSAEYYAYLNASKKAYDGYADVTRTANNIFDANPFFTGKAAKAVKRFIKLGTGKMINDTTDMHDMMIKDQKYIMEAFERIVDASPNARIEYDTLEKINYDFKSFYRRFSELAVKTKKVMDNLNAEFGGEVPGGFPYPNSRPALDSFEDICGGDEPERGYFKECQNRLVEFDNVMNNYLKGRETPFNSADLNKRMKAVSDLMHGYHYDDPKMDKTNVEILGNPNIKTVKALNDRLDMFCDNVDLYFNGKDNDITLTQGDLRRNGSGTFLCPFGAIEAAKDPLSKNIVSLPFYNSFKNYVTENARKHPGNKSAYRISPMDAALAFEVGGAAKSYLEKGNLSELRKNALAFYNDFQQGGVNSMMDLAAGTCSLTGVTSLPVTSAGQGSALPNAMSVPGLLNANTLAGGMNVSITNIWTNLGNAINGQGVASLNNIFQTAGYISVYGASFFNLSGKGVNPGKSTDKTAPASASMSGVGQTTITGLSTKESLLLYDPKNDKYEFEELIERIGNGYKPTEDEITALTELYDEYFEKLESGNATEHEIEVAEHLLNGLVVIKEDANMPAGFCSLQLNDNLINELSKRLNSDSFALLTIEQIKNEKDNIGPLYASDSISFDIKEDRIGIVLTLKVIDPFGDTIGKHDIQVRDDHKIIVDDSKRVRTGNVSDTFITITGVNGGTAFGGNQAWFENDPDMGKIISERGCGVIASVNQYLYLTGQTTISKEDYKKLVYVYLNAEDMIEPEQERYSELRRQQIRGPIGGAFPGEMTDFVTNMCEKEGVNITSEWDYTKDYEADYDSMKKQLDNGIPVVWGMYDMGGDGVHFYSYHAGKYENVSNASSHYVTATAIYEETDDNGKLRRMVEVSSWGEIYYIDYDQYIEAVSEPGVNRPFSSVTNTTVK